MQRFYLFLLIILVTVFPSFVFSNDFSSQCSKVGFTVLTINGIFTNKKEAQENADALRWKLDKSFNSQPLTVGYLHNPSHLAGLGDVAMSVYQKIFDNGTVEDYDLIEMLKTASEKVKTQKLLIVAHSQGNFYANSFYDTIAGKEGGVSEESIGVYAVATPAGRVAGGGKWLTSDTDKVIADLVALFPFKKIMAPNASIVLAEDDDANGHNFSGVYLKYRGGQIVSDIQETLGKLQTNSLQNESSPCLAAPKLTLVHKAEGAVLSIVDPKAQSIKDGAVIVGKSTYQSGVAVVNVTKKTISVIGGLAKLPFQSDQKYIVGNQAVSLYAIKNEKNDAPATAVSVVDKKFEETPPVIVQPIFPQKEFSNQENLARIQNSLDDIKKQVVILEKTKPPLAIYPPTINTEDNKVNVLEIRGGPRILFVGAYYPGFGGGSPAPQAEPAIVEQSEAQETSSPLPSPMAIASQCDYSLALDGCLLATTTVVFSWAGVPSATHYAINKNGEYSTTTNLSFSAEIPDFSDYSFSVSAVSSATTSATTTVQTVSVATIPIAINEIAWMGTTASSYDEWLELKNNTGHRINLSQWAIESADSLPYIVLSGEMSPYEYRILERRANTITASSIVSVYGNGSSQWVLGNGGEELFLSYSSTTLDKSPAITGDAWTAGENTSSTTRKTMERINSKQSGATSTNWTTWGTNINFIKNGQDADGNQISGTPGECNSASFINMNGGQNIASSTTLEANNCYYVSSESNGLSVSASSTLAIEEGVRISLYQNNLVVNGVIIASGTLDNPIIIDSFSGTPTNNRINVSGANGTSTMNNVIISNTGGIYLNNSASLEIVNAEFANNRYGVELNNNSSVVIENSNFASTTGEALSAYNGSSISVSSSTISNTIDADAIGIYDSNLTISSTTINTVLDGDGIGVYNSVVSMASSIVNNIYDGDGIGAYDSTVSIASSTVSNVLDGDGIGLYDSTTTISNVVIENVSGDGIAVYDGSISGTATIDGVAVEF